MCHAVTQHHDLVTPFVRVWQVAPTFGDALGFLFDVTARCYTVGQHSNIVTPFVCVWQVAPTFGDAPGVLRDVTANSKARPRLLHSEQDPRTAPTPQMTSSKQKEGPDVTMVFCGAAQYKVTF